MTLDTALRMQSATLGLIAFVAIRNGAEQMNPWLIGFGLMTGFASGFLLAGLEEQADG